MMNGSFAQATVCRPAGCTNARARCRAAHAVGDSSDFSLTPIMERMPATELLLLVDVRLPAGCSGASVRLRASTGSPSPASAALCDERLSIRPVIMPEILASEPRLARFEWAVLVTGRVKYYLRASPRMSAL